MKGENRTGRACDSKESKRPVLLITKGHSRCLEVKIGNLGVELWDFPNDEAKPYARLLFKPDRVGGGDATIGPEKDGTRLHVDLDVMEGGTISVAIEQWLLSFESETKDESVPSLRMQLATLSITLFPQTNGQGARAEFVVRTEEGVQCQAVLTRLEASLLGTLLESLVEDEEADCHESLG
ncbi:MAG: hypothetical protein EWM72_01906 [Nitrospira sp.]|nr:MAG: hypothetical protein EWM72_01906 [Nitrospira sp.]